jgi:probable rRNA maturation factor
VPVTPDPEDLIDVELDHPTLDVETDAIRALAAQTIEGEQGQLVHLTIVLSGHETVHSLNREYLGHDYRTDVLSFDLNEDSEPKTVDGEVYVDLDTALERHQEFGASFEEEVRRYAIHGVLHLLGYDDATPAQKAAMHALEDRYLQGAGDPTSNP